MLVEKKICSLFSCYFILCFSAGCNFNVNKKSGKLYLEKDSINIGTHKIMRDSINVQFKMSNTGNSVLHIKSSGTSCGCSKLFLSDSIFQPNQKGTLIIRFHSKDTGYFYKSAVVETDGTPVYKTLTFFGRLVNN